MVQLSDMTPTGYLVGGVFRAFSSSVSPVFCDMKLEDRVMAELRRTGRYHSIPRPRIAAAGCILAYCSVDGNLLIVNIYYLR